MARRKRQKSEKHVRSAWRKGVASAGVAPKKRRHRHRNSRQRGGKAALAAGEKRKAMRAKSEENGAKLAWRQRRKLAKKAAGAAVANEGVSMQLNMKSSNNQ